MSKQNQVSVLQREKHFHFITKKEFTVDISDLDREDKIAKHNEIAKQDNKYKCCFSDRFIQRSRKLFVAEGDWEMVPDNGPECECDKKPRMLIVEQKWHNGGLIDRFNCNFCKKTKSLKNYYA